MKSLLFPECDEVIDPETFEPFICMFDAKIPVMLFMDSYLYYSWEFLDMLTLQHGQLISDHIRDHENFKWLMFNQM